MLNNSRTNRIFANLKKNENSQCKNCNDSDESSKGINNICDDIGKPSTSLPMVTWVIEPFLVENDASGKFLFLNRGYYYNVLF